MSDYKVGRGKPPKHTQYPPGTSGNPKGRPRKSPRADVPGQIYEDLRTVTQARYKLKGSQEALPGGLLVMRNLLFGAIAGKPTALRIYLDLLREAYRDNVANDPILYLIDAPRQDPLLFTLDEKVRIETRRHLARRSRKSRRTR